ncbi:MAG: AsnC family transcriptional regulator [Euryarchaeota archaeon]|nr:AsnC family transcriptional regulator [Euryarchaeota archaeon]
MVTIDNLNRQILDILERDGRKTYAEIAAELRRSESTIRDRIQRLERARVILGYLAAVDKRFVGYQTEGLVLCNVADPSEIHKAVEALSRLPNIVQVYLLSGERRVAFWVIARDNRDLEDLLRRYAAPLGLRDISLHIVTDRPLGLCVKI